MKDMTFDLIVIGTGSAGSGVARKCRSAGWKVAIVDSRPYGGTCAQRGCDPKKVLVGAADAIHAARRLAGRGVGADGAALRWADLVRFERTFTDPVAERSEKGLAKAGIDTLHGRARFVDRQSIGVDGRVIEGRHIHIATGAMPVRLRIPGEELLTTSDRFLELEELPRRIVFLGSGFISFEFAHVCAIAGAQVTMIEMLDRPLAGFDPDLVSVLVEGTRELGIELHLQTKVQGVERVADRLVVSADGPQGRRTFDADMVVHGAGRVPEIDDLDLEKGGVERTTRGIKVNQYLQSVSNPAVYAAGDAADSGPMLTPVAGFEGRIVAANLLDGNRQAVEYPAIPSVVFTLPPLAYVGLQEADARDKGLRFETHFARTDAWFSSRRLGERWSAHKVLVEEGSGRILGAHLLGPNSDELVNVFSVAMCSGMTAGELKQTIFAYPTRASDIAYMV
ncbi:MAG: NAD(P)/FAD-dependent oxidoreductase [Acidobacteria bacterium]|nr:NAD(P)/FAD-dependent oxidoreductase [Acidobacteriota bacterium]